VTRFVIPEGVSPRRAPLLAVFAFVLAGCMHFCAPPKRAKNDPLDDPGVQPVTVRDGDVATFVSIPWSFSTRSY